MIVGVHEACDDEGSANQAFLLHIIYKNEVREQNN